MDTGRAHDALHGLFERDWEWQLRRSPVFASSVGRHEYDTLLPDLSAAAIARDADSTRTFLSVLNGIDKSTLLREDQISASLFRSAAEDHLATLSFRSYEMPLSTQGGFHTNLTFLPRNTRFETVADYEAYVARLRAIPSYVAQQVAHMRSGLERGMTQPRFLLREIEAVIMVQVVETPENSTFWKPFKQFPGQIEAAEQERLRRSGQSAIMDGPVAAYRALLDFFRSEYMPGARASIGASELPDGNAYYSFLVKHHTTLEITPAEVHETGQQEVRRIRTEMQRVIDEIDFDGDFASFLNYLRTDASFYATTPDELLKEASWIAKRIDGKLPALFGKLPRQPYTVEPVPAEIAPGYTGGRYVSAAPTSTRSGTYWVNTYDLPSRPLYTLEALTLHEAVPGHHLQIAIGQELDDIPPFRHYASFTAFTEGWALYAERLGLEVGFYENPYSNFGRLTYEMWRACRLVVDTGMHVQGWTRQQAIDFMASNTALSLKEINVEVDRYISWPGQALGYKIGELQIRALRRRAEDVLGDRFDVRTFHDVVLGSGPIPLTTLEENVENWIQKTPGN